MHILFADRLPEQTLAELRARGHTCVMEPGLAADDLPAAVAGFDALVVRSTEVRRPVFEAADRLALVVRAGSGTNTIDSEVAAARGVCVCNVPGRNAAAVAELTLGLLLAIDRRIADNVADLRNGQWDKERYSNARGLLGSTMGIIGLGSVGLAVAERAAAFGIRLQALAKPGRADAVVRRAEELGITMHDALHALVSTSDVVTLHVPSCAETHHLVDAGFLDLMKQDAILLNTSRGDVIDEQALLKALDAGAVRAGLDVFTDEPGSGRARWDSLLARHPNVVATHHIGASTEQAQHAIAAGVTEVIDAFTAGEPRNCVNLQSLEQRARPSGRASAASADASGQTPRALVRPFPARLVTPDWAPYTVVPLADPFPDTGAAAEQVVIEPARYDDAGAALYVYRQADDDGGSNIGVVCEMAVRAFADGRVRGHEAVQPRRVEALLRHNATNVDPPALVTLIHRAGPAFRRTLDTVRTSPPLLDFPGPGGRRQTVWRVAEEAAAALSAELAAARHYIADGHHRVAAALREWEGSGTSADTGLLCVVHSMDGLQLSAFHRRVTGPVDAAAVLALLTETLAVRPAPGPPSPTPGSFGLYLAGRWFEVGFTAEPGEGHSALDVVVLQRHVLDELVRRSDGEQSIEVVPVRGSVEQLVAQCDADGGALFTLAPPPLDALTRLADAGGLMPPKTTYFQPKPCAGIFLRPAMP
ncbi:MAG TPA: DUF1015 family protein [Marmoricola sp.]